MMDAAEKSYYRKRLNAHGIVPTLQRLQIARVLLSRPQHLSAEQILGMVNRERGHVSKATVYNTLNLFARKGLIREVIVDPSRVFYDSTTVEHGHVYNVDTGELSDISLEGLKTIPLPELPPGQEIAGIDVVIRVRGIQSAS